MESPSTSDGDELYCCLQCRLVQTPAPECCECGSPAMGTLANQKSLLRYKVQIATKPITDRKRNVFEAAGIAGGLAAYTAIIAGSTVWLPVLPIVAVGVVGLGAITALRRGPAIRAIDMLDVKTSEKAVTRKGIARRLSDSLKTITSHANVLAEQAIVQNKKGVLFRRIRAVPFQVELEDGKKLVVLDTLRVQLPLESLGQVKADDPKLAALGIAGVPVSGSLDVATLRDGDAITITGEESTEIVSELAFYRDGGEAIVMRGRAHAVVAIRTAAR